MKSSQHLEEQVRQLQSRVSDFREQLGISPESPSTQLEAMLEELHTALEELRVAEDELHRQNFELLAAYEALQEERERYRDLFEFAPDAYLVTTVNGVIVEANQVAAHFLNIEAKQLIHKPITVFIPYDLRPHCRNMLLGMRQHLKTVTAEFQIQPRKSEPIDVAVKVSPVITEPNGVIGFRWLLRDISKRKQMEQALQAANEQLEARVQQRTAELEIVNQHKDELLQREQSARLEAERANMLKLQFLAMVSHELRTPLASIKGFASTLLAKDVEWSIEQWHDFMTIIDSEADKLTDLVEQLIDLSRMQAGTLKIMPEATSFSDIMRIAEHQLKLLAEQHQLVIDLADDLPLVLADRQRVAQVITNLVNNAAKFSPPHTVITITAAQEDQHLLVKVADQGEGIPAEMEAHIFEPFHQADALGTHGLGLGLAICKGLVEGNDGKLWVQESSSAGTTFAFTLKLAPAMPPELNRPAPPSAE
jgi:PAS domain S-box-containing protein